MEKELRLHLTGTRPLLLHNGRLANPLDSHTRRVAAISKKRNKTDQDYSELASLEARGGMYETTDGDLGLPAANVWRCLFDAAKAYKLGEDIKRALIPGPEVVPLHLGGKTIACDEYLTNPEHFAERLSYLSVVVNRRRTMRARARVPEGWEAEVSFVLLTDVLQVEKLMPVIQRAGRLGGLCDWRPIYGTFDAKVV